MLAQINYDYGVRTRNPTSVDTKSVQICISERKQRNFSNIKGERMHQTKPTWATTPFLYKYLDQRKTEQITSDFDKER